MPAEVTDRAKQILKLVESGDKSRAEPADDDVRQPSEVERILMETDLNNLSPMQAFMLVSDLVEKVKDEQN